MSESRGAASVTLDTIIFNAVAPNFEGDSAFVWQITRAVTDALISKGHEMWRHDPDDTRIVTKGIWIPTEASS